MSLFHFQRLTKQDAAVRPGVPAASDSKLHSPHGITPSRNTCGTTLGMYVSVCFGIDHNGAGKDGKLFTMARHGRGLEALACCSTSVRPVKQAARTDWGRWHRYVSMVTWRRPCQQIAICKPHSLCKFPLNWLWGKNTKKYVWLL